MMSTVSDALSLEKWRTVVRSQFVVA